MSCQAPLLTHGDQGKTGSDFTLSLKVSAARALTGRFFSNLSRECFPSGPPTKFEVFRRQTGRTDEVSWIEEEGKEGREGGKQVRREGRS